MFSIRSLKSSIRTQLAAGMSHARAMPRFTLCGMR